MGVTSGPRATGFNNFNSRGRKTAVAAEDEKLIVSFVVVPGSGKASVALKRGFKSVLWGDLDQGDAVSFLNYILHPLTDEQLEDRARIHGLRSPVK